MLDHQAEAARERWFGAKAAAEYLGLHRSTLFLAVQRKHLIPDLYTPGGQTRFREATLEAFRNRIAKEAVTSEAPLYAPVHTLSQLAHAINDVTPASPPAKLLRNRDIPDELKKVCVSAIDAIKIPPLSIPLCCVALRVFDPLDPGRLRMATPDALPRTFLHDYEMLRSLPNSGFVTDEALKTGKPYYCADTAQQSESPTCSSELIKRGRLGSFAVVPIVDGAVALGVLFLADFEPHAFTEHERAFLQGVAAQIATAVTNHTHAERLRAYANVSHELTRLALAFRAEMAQSDRVAAPSPVAAGAPDSADERTRDAVKRLLAVFRQATDADHVCALGFDGGDVPSGSPTLNALAEEVRRPNDGTPYGATSSPQVDAIPLGESSIAENRYRSSISAKDDTTSALAIGMPLGAGRRAAVAARWRRPAAWSDEDHLLLVTLAAACAMATGAA